MRLQLTCVALLLTCVITVSAQNGSFSVKPEYPRQGEPVTIYFDPPKVLTATDKPIEAVAYLFNEKGNKAKELVLKKEKKGFSATVTPEKDTRAIAFSFTSGEKKLNTGTEGQVVLMYDDKQQPVAGANSAAAIIYNSWGNYLMGIERQPELALKYAEKEYNSFPDKRVENRDMYFQLLNSVKKKEAQPAIQQELEAIQSKGNLTEKDYQFLSMWYPRIQQKEKGTELTTEMKTKFPDGAWKKSEMMNRFYEEQDPENQEKMYNEFITKYPAKDEMEKSNQDYMQGYIARTYATDKEKKNLEKFAKYMQALPVESKNASYNNLAWGMAEKDQDLDFAKLLSKEATL
ncbi:MAG TPA: hypothetical protein VM012_02150, partial [Flavitalea sp.]|nr:hypothetical protein [Flavitalea sp.]